MAAAALPPGLIDTDLLIDAERGLPDALSFLADQQASAGIQLSAISAMELIVGCRNQRELQNVVQSIASAVVHELSPVISRQARDWLAQFSLSHGLQIADALIAATAAEQHLPLYTKMFGTFRCCPASAWFGPTSAAAGNLPPAPSECSLLPLPLGEGRGEGGRISSEIVVLPTGLQLAPPP